MNQLSVEQQALLTLMRRSLWGTAEKISGEVNWEVLDITAKDQGVISFAYDGVRGENTGIPQDILKKWNEKMLQGVVNNARLMKAQNQVLAWFSQAGIRTAVLKGSSNAKNYPQPDLRVLGDIDVLVKREDLKRAQEVLENHGYRLHEDDPGYHISFSCRKVYVEVHYDVTEFPDSPGGRLMETYASRFLEDVCWGSVSGYEFPMLTEANQALTLLLHMIRHMFGSCIGLRQLCDWAMYIANADAEEFQRITVPVLETCGLLRYAKVATRTCVRYLGLKEDNLDWCADTEEELCDAFIRDVFRGGSLGVADKDGMGSLFTNSLEMGTSQAPWQALIDRLNQAAYRHFPGVKKCRVLLPLIWVYLPLRYFTLSALGYRPKKSVKKIVESAQQRRELYEMLKLYELEK